MKILLLSFFMLLTITTSQQLGNYTYYTTFNNDGTITRTTVYNSGNYQYINQY